MTWMFPRDRATTRSLVVGCLTLVVLVGMVGGGSALQPSPDSPTAGALTTPTSTLERDIGATSRHDSERERVTVAACGSDEVRVSGQGTFFYEADRRNPRYTSDYHAMREVPVNITVTTEAGTNQTVQTVRTGPNGYFAACIRPGSVAGTPDRVFATIWAINPAVRVLTTIDDIDEERDVYKTVSDSATIDGTTNSIRLGSDTNDSEPSAEIVPDTPENNTAFHIANVSLTARTFIERNTGDGWTRKQIRVLYPFGDTAYDSIRDLIRIEANEAKTDRETIVHEYGHAVQYAIYSYNDSRYPDNGSYLGLPDTCHSRGTESDPELALREGFAIYLPTQLGRGWADRATYYDRTNDSVTCRPADDDGTFDGYRVEGSVTGALYDVTDGGPTDDDGLDESFRTAFDALRDGYPQDILDVYDTLEDDVDDTAALRDIFLTHGIDVAPPNITLADGRSQTTTPPTLEFDITVSDAQSNVSTLQITRADGPWRTIATDTVTAASYTDSYNGSTVTYTVRATDAFGNNQTATVQVTNGTDSRLPPIANRYDTNPEDDAITLVELGDASQDYANGKITLTELGIVSKWYANT